MVVGTGGDPGASAGGNATPNAGLLGQLVPVEVRDFSPRVQALDLETVEAEDEEPVPGLEAEAA